jgi:hypothetical protein
MSTLSCAAKFTPAFMALNRLKKAGDLCRLVREAGLSFACNAPDLMDKVDRKALCELMCCCQAAAGPAKPGVRRSFQGCVSATLIAADAASGFKGHYKPEVSYGANGLPMMDSANPTRPKYFGLELMSLMAGAGIKPAWRNYPAGSSRPDVVTVKDPSLPPTGDNIRKAYEMKFDYGDGKSDVYSESQKKRYNGLFQDKIDDKPLTPTSCKCNKDGDSDEENGKKLLETANAMQTAKDQGMSLVAQVNSEAPALAAAIVGGPGVAGAAGTAVNALRAVGAFLGFAY